MTITLHAWMIVPGLLTVLALFALTWKAFKGGVEREDLNIVFFIWTVLMAVSLLSIWSAS